MLLSLFISQEESVSDQKTYDIGAVMFANANVLAKLMNALGQKGVLNQAEIDIILEAAASGLDEAGNPEAATIIRGDLKNAIGKI